MASTCETNSDPEVEEEDAEIDFCSANFDPMKALSSSKVKVPFDNVTVFPTLSSYAAAVSKVNKKAKSLKVQQKASSVSEKDSKAKSDTDVKKVPDQSTSTAAASMLKSSPVIKESHKGTVFGDPKSTKEKENDSDLVPSSSHSTKASSRHERNVFTRMEEMYGPLELLTRCVNEHRRVRVMTRSAVHVRSICRGFILAFDKMFNMALIDVDEIYRRPVCQGKVRARISHKLKLAHRTLATEREEQTKKFMAENEKNLISLSLSESQKEETTKFTELKDPKQVSPSATRTPQTRDSCKDTAIGETKQKTKSGRSKKCKSVYSDMPAPYSKFEREALMLGIPDENVDHRRVNQLFIRGENVVLVSVVED